MILQALFVFTIMFVLDIVWARYTTAVTDRRRTVASSYSMAIIALGACATLSYVDDPRMIVPAMLGAFCGTFIGISNPSPKDDQ